MPGSVTSSRLRLDDTRLQFFLRIGAGRITDHPLVLVELVVSRNGSSQSNEESEGLSLGLRFAVIWLLSLIKRSAPATGLVLSGKPTLHYLCLDLSRLMIFRNFMIA